MKIHFRSYFILAVWLVVSPCLIASGNPAGEEDSLLMTGVWIPDNGDGTYTNPVIYADYSDPDIIRVGGDFYMVASSFNCIPGVPVLHSKDLINWEIINHVFYNQPPDDVYDEPGHGLGVWAPSIRYHDSLYYVCYGDPDYGIYMAKTSDPAGVWEHKLIHPALGWIDPCPFWDDNDSAYLVHAYAGSRTGGYNSVLIIRRMSQDGEIIYENDSALLFDGRLNNIAYRVIEGPKMYKRNGYYYVFAPYGGVSGGSQAVLRATDVWGPYQDTTVLEQGSTDINGPHQGGWVELESGESWFMHFQEKLPYGRIVHLQPVEWIDDWPFMGVDYDGNGIGEPVPSWQKPDVGTTWPVVTPQTSDKFDSLDLGLQWQWHSNYDSSWWSLSENPGNIRLYSVNLPDDYTNLWDVGSLLMQKLPAEEFSATVKVHLHLKTNEKTGLLVMGQKYSYIGIACTDTGNIISQRRCLNARNGGSETEVTGSASSLQDTILYLRVDVESGGICYFSYSVDGLNYTPVGDLFTSDEGRWIGAKVGLFCLRPYDASETPGYCDFEWFNIDYRYNQLPGAARNPVPEDADSVIVGSDFELIWDGDMVLTDSFFVYLDTLSDPINRVSSQTTYSFEPDELEPGKIYYWRVDAKNVKGTTTGPVWSFYVEDMVGGLTSSKWSGYSLEQNVPNPFRENTIFAFRLPEQAKVSLKLISTDGRLMHVIADQMYTSGRHTINFERNSMPEGIYFLKMEVQGKSFIRSIMIQ